MKYGPIDYNPDTGIFTGLNGDAVTRKHPRGYLRLRVLGKEYLAHRLAYFIMTGAWPMTIDHINGNKTDNRWCNLRSVTQGVNIQNQKRAHKSSKLGIMGVSRVGDKFKAQIHMNGRHLYLGIFNNTEDAHAAYLSAKRRLHEGNTL